MAYASLSVRAWSSHAQRPLPLSLQGTRRMSLSIRPVVRFSIIYGLSRAPCRDQPLGAADRGPIYNGPNTASNVVRYISMAYDMGRWCRVQQISRISPCSLNYRLFVDAETASPGKGQLLTPYHQRRTRAPTELPCTRALRFQCCQPRRTTL